METYTKGFGRQELALLHLRRLFEQRGFTKVKAARFEDYALYVENKNFLDTESIITFMDVDGKLLALKPDVTLSIIKNVPQGKLPAAQKLYYIDEVYRLSPENREYKVHNQIGVELINGVDGFSNLEIVDLALDSLAMISERYALDLSHLGFVSGLLAELNMSHRMETVIFEHIHAKNTWDIAGTLEQAEVSQEKISLVLELASIHGDFVQALERAKKLICNDQMQSAWDELAQVGEILQGRESGVNLDFSVVNDLDYYNGLIFRGYVEGIPSLVLTGGRYDNLMKRMGKKNGAIGFAVSLDALDTYLKREKKYDFDLLITYPEPCDFGRLLQLSKKLGKDGTTVRLERESSDLQAAGLRYRKHMRLVNGTLEEVVSC